jgi:hypothetical protein
MKASSESGECASLISTGSFSVFEAVCLPAMGLLVPLFCLGLVPSRETFSSREAAAEDEQKGRARRRGLLGAGPGYFCKRKPNTLGSGEQTVARKAARKERTTGEYRMYLALAE